MRSKHENLFFANFPLYPHTHFYTHSHTFNSNFFLCNFFHFFAAPQFQHIFINFHTLRISFSHVTLAAIHFNISIYNFAWLKSRKSSQNFLFSRVVFLFFLAMENYFHTKLISIFFSILEVNTLQRNAINVDRLWIV